MLNNTVAQIMIPKSEFKTISSEDFFHDAVESLNFNHWGAVFIVDKNNHVDGIFTDGDARRVLTKNQNPLAMLNATPITNYMTSKPKVIKDDASIKDALMLMNEKSILVMPIVDSKDELIGLVHLQHAVKFLLKNL